MIKERYNVKPGDMITTDIGSGFLTKETRAYWFYLFKSRINRIKKSHFWQMVDCGNMKINYADNKKYRRVQKKYRTLDTRMILTRDLESKIDEFMGFVSLPCTIVLTLDSQERVQVIVEKLNNLSLDYYKEKSYSSEAVIRVMAKND